MFDCHQSETAFWRTMNPARLHALFRAYFRTRQAPASPAPAGAGGRQGLLEYLQGGE